MSDLNNRYRILQTLGSGGCGQTFLAEDTHLPSRRRCVVKQLKPATLDAGARRIIQERFEDEAKVLEELGAAHDQIPALHAYFVEAGEFYLVQDWIEGQNLVQRVQTQGVFSESAARQLLADLLPVLQYVHAQGIIHRDIKPENIMLRERDGKPILIDFGAVKEVVGTVVDGYGTPTSSVIIGSPGFMPLEQAIGKPMFASDLYSLGLTIIYLLTGKRPNEMSDLLTGEVAWRKHAPQVGPELAALLDKATRTNAQERYRTAQDMLTALQSADGATDVTVTARSAPPKNNPPPPITRPATPARDANTPHRISILLAVPEPDSPVLPRPVTPFLDSQAARQAEVAAAPSKLTIQYPAIWLPILLWGGVGVISGLVANLVWELTIRLEIYSTFAPILVLSPGFALGVAIYLFGEYASKPPIGKRNHVFRYIFLTVASVLGWYCTWQFYEDFDSLGTVSDLLNGLVMGAFIVAGELLCWRLASRQWAYSLVIVTASGLTALISGFVLHYAWFFSSPLVARLLFWTFWQGTILAAHVVALKITNQQPLTTRSIMPAGRI